MKSQVLTSSLIRESNRLTLNRISEVQQQPNGNHSGKSRLPDIPPSPNTTPRKQSAAANRSGTPTNNGRLQAPDTTPTKVPLKDVDGPSPHSIKTLRRRETDTDTLVSDRQSVMSFAFKGADQIRPVQRRVRAPANGSAPTNGNRYSGGSIPSSGSGSGSKMSHSAANAKFAHRLRSPETVHEDYEHHHLTPDYPVDKDKDKEATIRLHSSKTRRSLPPAMAFSPSTNLPEQGLRNGTLLNPPRIVSHGHGHAHGKGGSTTGPSSTTQIPMAGRIISAATAKRLSMKAAEQARSATPESSALALDGNDSSMALWAAYGAAHGNGNGNGNGSEVNTPRRVVAGASASGRQLGGRI